jgi:hypothetical protein
MKTGYGIGNKTYLRSCDFCGHQWEFGKLKYVGLGKYSCPPDRKMLTREECARHAARPIPMLVRPRKSPRKTLDVPTYTQDEGYLLGLIQKFATTASVIGPSGAILATADGGSAAECGVYLREMLLEDRRPLTWMASGLKTLKAIGAFLLTKQYGSLTGPSPSEATSSVLYGGLQNTNPAFPFAEGAAGLTFLGLYDLTGDGQWLEAADRCAWFLRQLQRTDLLTANPTVDSAGNPMFVGGWPAAISAAKVPSGFFYTAHAWYLWFLARYRDVRGAVWSLGTLTATGDFTAAPFATVQQTIDDALAFYVSGKFTYSTTSSTTVAPLSFAAPQYLCTPALAARFSLATSGSYFGVNGCDVAFALRGLYELEGYTDRVAAIFEWLMAFSSNAAFELVDGHDFPALLPVVRAGAKGEYDPKVGIADFLALGTAQVATPTLQTNGTSFYSQNATAMLGPVYNASGRLLRTWKDAMSIERPLTADRTDVRQLTQYETAGLSFQAPATSVEDMSLAVIARNALVYRALPSAFAASRGVA